MKKIKILNIVGARPNFMKIAPLFRIYKKYPQIDSVLVHTGQHSDDNMSGMFLRSLNVPNPNYVLNLDKKTPISSISSIISGLEKVFLKEKPDLVVVVGDVNSSLAAALAAHKANIRVAHVEAGLRSRDKSMPEEINRIVIDQISDILFVTEQSGINNLKKEGIDESKIFFTGNVMIDNLIFMMPQIDLSPIVEQTGLTDKSYIVVTMHRPINVDTKEKLLLIKEILEKVIKSTGLKIVFPMHPRTRNNFKYHNFLEEVLALKGHILTEPMGYIDFVKLVKNSSLVLTDSGGIQEEAAFLKVPTITLRESTERPSTIESGANMLHPIGEIDNLMKKIKTSINTNRNLIKDIPLNDGKASQRIVDIILKHSK
ncbi:MAG: UDP-N-acetylglucosamine 2-epimerase [Candidatus Zambryskibacteria bacterium RIFCSPHIGHO2_12_FULL_38_34]|uniref:UDP-N-acetylglucosamine 2-epimerase n=1 Tax=Candidatus Zambryskibacteria bacterium RIFCSPLOWO2_12_FULL_39_16 TaxID=1802775 RepID=A0A1G2UQV2_9BACT|nr:MAG: UDP-N-acetylglucosamine 2-epimerase [Candidatus Zambryskibacteria bacterium RIFCSPHIGHO2_02_FULL_38_22]OHA97333.1 MAG: UDP-N-acetylglucosamine 2-epimerase [Candidatus Zambryskibacteria bacterium RIFCSPHIGHO2_12_FULL_38_34]OHB08223.1 MAG: UDP-N-acetylglucosamine 2-epimerase [Candidatus Zambryskibacteria bacterium RIFCSPLOWO2_02_FULL_38_13]OHB11765.1 MAG: UDP-N-acetylglucosamine 2-epimerase [Candidatus Zambryskibacteria bacterium RIFCSPLOWO2_12_FULL_39_16]